MLPVAYALIVAPTAVEPAAGAIAAPVIGLAVMWALASMVILTVVRGERRPLASIGVQRTSTRWMLLAVGMGAALMLLVPVLSIAVGSLLPSSNGGVEQTAAQPWPLLLAAVLTAAVTEEVLFRGYAMERVLELTGSRVAAVAIPVAFFTVTHAGSWNLAHVVGVVLPLGIALSLLYLWRRNLLVVMIAHLVVDLPLVAIAAVTEGA